MKRKRPYKLFFLLCVSLVAGPGPRYAAAQTSSPPSSGGSPGSSGNPGNPGNPGSPGSPGNPGSPSTQPPALSFAFQARLDTIRQPGFYKISLQPELVARCRQDLGDLRISDGEDRFIPYVLKGEQDPDGSKEVYSDIPDPVIRQMDSSNQHSYIYLQYSRPYRIDRVDLTIKGPVLYRRDALIYDEEGMGRRSLTTISIDPGQHRFRLPAIRTSHLLIEIVNRDDAPLVIKRAATVELKEYLVAYLQPGNSYRLLAGNTQASTPQYDLKYFVDSLTKDPPEIPVGRVEVTPIGPVMSAALPSATVAGKHSRMLLWSIIVIVLLLLIFFSFRLMSAIPEKDKHDRL